MNTVTITVRGGRVYIDACPQGTQVEIRDYDTVDPMYAESDGCFVTVYRNEADLEATVMTVREAS